MTAAVVPQEVRVPGVATLEHGQARTFVFEDGDYEGRGFVMALRDETALTLVAYRNRCAHVSFDLDMGTGQFWSSKLSRIYCRTHGACYEPRTGVCDRGPCVGAALESFAVVRDGDDAIVSIGGRPPTT
ncbi:MAG: Rieske 2Fe-2S domain-containing protein [Deltaproteobacteria bacterium]|nr:Rieske 2Fe-2S domain-containing protein [Deltaproteobacteria bacterium]